MFVITADQVGSRDSVDRVRAALERINTRFALTLAAERTAGDELQLATGDADTALSVVLELTRSGWWSVGCGVGPVELPLPQSTREASGAAFIAARVAIDRAKKRPTRVALVSDPDSPTSPAGADLEAVLDLVMLLRERRSAEGWELYDLTTTGLTQAQAAERLGITPQAASKRAQVAQLRAEQAATVALGRLMQAHHDSVG
ncbi:MULTISPECIES: DNA-binding protein [unclassified Diaminobutyricimonas]|uniref:DNA-binding protein n=1 Tax=unclassified Diaminobutyricimonas TaxID=2643261 RepID=UPI0012F49044|nr:MULTISPECIES: DNA-binding protein [unclassified Diaminobutyricimonas]